MIPELPAADRHADLASPDRSIRILEEDPLSWPQLTPGAHDTPFLEMAQGDLRLTVEGIGCFRIHCGKQIAWKRASQYVSDQDLRTFLLGSAVGALLIQRGTLVLHGNALERDGQSIVCLGHSGAGKSTLAYALMLQGWRLLADDLVAITPSGQVLSGIPRIKLWHDAVKAFGLDPDALPPLVPPAPGRRRRTPFRPPPWPATFPARYVAAAARGLCRGHAQRCPRAICAAASPCPRRRSSRRPCSLAHSLAQQHVLRDVLVKLVKREDAVLVNREP